MKAMTCRQLGGPCDLAHHGEGLNEVIKAQDRHLREATAAGEVTMSLPEGDEEPLEAPISGMKWYRQAQSDFAALPDEAAGG